MVTPKNGFTDDMDEDDDDLDMPPKSGGGGLLARFNMPQGITQIILVSVIVTMVILAMMSFAGGVSFVTKKDFTSNMAGVSATLTQIQSEVNQAKADVAQAKTDVNTALQNLPNTISSQVSSGVSQATSTLNSQLTNLSGRLDTYNNSMSQYVTNSQLNGYVTNSELEDYVSESELASYNYATIAKLTAEIELLKDMIEELEEEEGSGGDGDGDGNTPVSGNVKVEIEPYDTHLSSTDDSITVNIHCENDSDTNIILTNLELLVYVSSWGSNPVIVFDIYSTTIPLRFEFNSVGGAWYAVGTPPYPIKGLKIDAYDDRDGLLTLTFDTSSLTAGINMYVELYGFDYTDDD